MVESSMDLLIETLALLHELKSELNVMIKQVEKVSKTVERLANQRETGGDRSHRSRSPIPVSEETRRERQIYQRRSSLSATQILS